MVALPIALKREITAGLNLSGLVIFIFDPKKVVDIKRVFPFDSGAFAMKLYTDFFFLRIESN